MGTPFLGILHPMNPPSLIQGNKNAKYSQSQAPSRLGCGPVTQAVPIRTSASGSQSRVNNRKKQEGGRQPVQVPRGTGACCCWSGRGSVAGDGGGLHNRDLFSWKMAVVSSPHKSCLVAGHSLLCGPKPGAPKPAGESP